MDTKTYSMRNVAPTVSAVLRLPVPKGAQGAPIAEAVADLAGHQGVAVLALDALGRFAWDRWHGEMPYLSGLHAARSITLESVMPSITPVNFATMVTGTDQAGHGIRTFKDSFTCETLFDVVRQAGGRSAGIGLTGYTGNELLARFADIAGNAGTGTDDSVAERVRAIAEGDRPAFLIAQFGKVDDVFHKHGPSSPAVVPMLRETDARLERLVPELRALGYGIIILSDHGQHDVEDAAPGRNRGSHGEDRPEDRLVPCTWV